MTDDIIVDKNSEAMTKPSIKFTLLNGRATLPFYAHPGDAAFDLSSTEDVVLKKGEVKVIPTGLSAEFSSKYFVSFKGRSGLAAKYGLQTLAGVIDSSYRGEWKVVLVNLGKKLYRIRKGERVAQAILQPLLQAKIQKVNRLSDTKRGRGGFGSSG